MQNDLLKMIEEQSEIIAIQAKVVNELSQVLLQHISADELECILKKTE